MSFGWSVGDLIGGIQMIAQVLAALSNSTGSSKKFKEVITQLRAFEMTLKWVRQYAEKYEDRNDEESIAAFLPIVNASREKIDSILKQLDGYQKHLGPASKLYKSRLTDGIFKIKFNLFEEKDILGWQNSIALLCASLTTMIGIHLG